MKIFITILLLIIFIPSCSRDNLSNDLPFESESWKAGDVRLHGRMRKSIFAQKEMLIGKTQAEVKKTLGEPGLIARDPCCRDETIGDTYRYDIDSGGFGERWFHRAAIYITFDEPAGKAIEVTLGDY